MRLGEKFIVVMIGAVVSAFVLLTSTCATAAEDALSIQNENISLTVSRPGAYEVRAPGESALLRAEMGAEIDHHWIRSSDYPKAKTVRSSFREVLGNGQELITTFSGLANRPTLVRVLRVYDQRPFGDIEVRVTNSTHHRISIQNIRVVDAEGPGAVDLSGPDVADRVLSDSFSEIRPVIHIRDLKDAFGDKTDRSAGLHRAVGSQLIYNRMSGQSVLLAALTSQRWLTLLHLRISRNVHGEPLLDSWTVDSTGTTEILKSEFVARVSFNSLQELSFRLEPGAEMASERVLISAGKDYHTQLENYGHAVRDLHHGRVESEAPQGWWSWMTWNGGITSAAVLTNAEWVAENLKAFGYRYVLIDEGYGYARGELTTANATQFPEGLAPVIQRISNLGLVPGVWTAPFEVSERAWVFHHHPDWLVRTLSGAPHRFAYPNFENLYVLDTTHPGAQKYLRDTYCRLAAIGIKYIKLDFMEDTAVEGVYHRPNTTALEAQRIGLEVIRRAVGDGVLLDKDGSPMLNTVGIVDEGRISRDTNHSFTGTKDTASGVAARYYMHRNFFVNDPDAFAVSLNEPTQGDSPVSLAEAETAIVLSAVSGGMFDIGGDLPLLTIQPDRLALVKNIDLLQMVAVGRASTPLDLMDYAPEDEQPSLFLLREDQRLTMFAIFNWTGTARSHSFPLADLGFNSPENIVALDVLHPEAQVSIASSRLEVKDQPPHSVRLIRLTDKSVPAATPSVLIRVPPQVELGTTVKMFSVVDRSSVPAISIHWEFGDGVSAEGTQATHAYTVPGVFTISVQAEGVDGLVGRKTASIHVVGDIDNHFHFQKNRRQHGECSCSSTTARD